MSPSVQLLGVAKANSENSEVIFLSDRRFLLLAYLALKADWVSREQLTLLFFEDADSASTRKNLRHLLYRARSLEFANLESSGENLRWLVHSDVAEFLHLIHSNRHLEALDVYHGQFLSGLSSDLPELANWLESQRESLHTAYRDAALFAAKQLLTEAKFEAAQKIGFKVLATDPLSEDMLQVLLTCALQTGAKLEALRAFETFKTTLKQELNLSPLEATLQLATELNQQESKIIVPLEKSKLQNFPVQQSAFVGRDVDLSEIASLLTQSHVRLLSLVGAGGMGKTRLAIEVAREQAHHFTDGAVFVPLAGVSQSRGIASAVASAVALALGLPMVEAATQAENLKNYLADKHLLLVLDNFEHLLDGSGLVLELFTACPKLKFLITTREALGFQSEHLVDVMGLDVPKDALGQIELFDSVQLFLRNAKRVNPRFILESQDKAFVVQICQLLQGSPLALELASNWLRGLNLEEIAKQIQTSLDFLSNHQADIPARHRSIKAVFDSSWVLLTPEQQRVLAQLSLLPSGFTLWSATRIAKTNPAMLMTLVSKSLINRHQNRFGIHESIRQYAVQQLEPSQKEAALLELSLLAKDWALAVAENESTPKDFASVGCFEDEFENITLALEWSFQHQPVLCAEIAHLPLYFWYASARKHTGITWLTALLEIFPDRTAIRGKLLYTRCILSLGTRRLELVKSDGLEALAIAQNHYEQLLEAQVLGALALIYLFEGQSDLAIESILTAIQINQTLCSNNLEATLLNTLGYVYTCCNQLEQAAQVFEQLISRCQVTGNKRGLAHANANLAGVYGNLGDLSMKKVLLEQASIIYREATDTTNLCGRLLDLAYIGLQKNQLSYAKNILIEAAELCLKMQEPPMFAAWFVLSANLMQQEGFHAKALHLKYMADAWMTQPTFDLASVIHFDFDQSAKFFDAQQQAQFRFEVAQLSTNQAMQYALASLELHNQFEPALS